MNFFAYPWLLLALIPAGLLIFYYLFCKPQPGVIMQEIAPAMKIKRSGLRFKTAPAAGILTAAALLIMIVAAARPRLGNEKLIIRHKGIDIIMILDLSGSMAAIDVPNDFAGEKSAEKALRSGKLKNRLEAAKSELAKFIERRPNDRIGLIGFAEYGYNLSPPTLDHQWLNAAAAPLEPGIIGSQTGIASPVASAIRRLDKSTAPRKVMVLFTDGQNNVTHNLTPLATAELAREKNIILYTVGIGGDNAYMEQEGFFGKNYVRYPGSFDEKLLRDMAEATGGKYFHAADESGMNSVMQEINQLEKTNFEQPRYIEYSEFAPALTVIALVLLMLAQASKNFPERTLP